MTEAQALFDGAAAPCCPEQLRAPVLHRVLQYDPILGHIWGGKGVGSQVPRHASLSDAALMLSVSLNADCKEAGFEMFLLVL